MTLKTKVTLGCTIFAAAVWLPIILTSGAPLQASVLVLLSYAVGALAWYGVSPAVSWCFGD